ncbi:thioredoxin [Micromonospora craterilacus]|uniref:Thioredoxin n=1 Tax=Micromonospora craterilacus TaxID=1655439 RepID=A0A2W2EPD9_9ACTN|nr:thioredoxin [Micromonospora craterilacus]
MTRVAVLAGVLLAATVVGLWHRRRSGRIRSVSPTPGPSAALAGLGVTAGAPTLVQFSSAVCAPCRATRRVLERVRATVDGVRLVEVDAEQHLDAARELGVWRTPTVLLVDGDGRVARRASGVPDAGQLTEAVRELCAGVTR